MTQTSSTGDDPAGRIAVVIAAAGIGRRMGGSLPKQFHNVAGGPLFLHTVRAFLASHHIFEVIIVAAADHLDETQTLCEEYLGKDSRMKFVAGGARRQDSVFNGLKATSAPFALVHDAARPMVSERIIADCCHALRLGKAVLTAIPVVDTIKRVAAGIVTATIDRTGLYRAQTPQGAATLVLIGAFQRFGRDETTDESSLLELAGVPVEIIPGDEENFKITLPEDLARAEERLRNTPLERKPSPSTSFNTALPRIGHGFDAHRFARDRDLILGGVKIPWPLGLDGHSDADVIIHAVCDALLGASAQGDIGRAFPDSDDQYKGINSLILLERVMQSLAPLLIGNIDITVICQAPKLAPYISEMRQNLLIDTRFFADQIHTAGCINIKATTEEKMGYTGRGEGISCHAVALLVPTPPQPRG